MKQEVIKIGDVSITVSEIPVKTSRKLLSNFMPYLTNEKVLNVETLLESEYDLLVDLSKDFIKVSKGAIDDFGYDTLEEEIWPVIARVNERFLGKILLGLTIPSLEPAIEGQKVNQAEKLVDNSTKQSSG